MILLYRSEPHWSQLLEQEGVPFTTGWNDRLNHQVVILNGEPDRGDIPGLRHYVQGGGGLIAGAAVARRLFPDLQITRTRLHYLLPDASRIFSNVGITDLDCRGWRITGANVGFNQESQPALRLCVVGHGAVVILPFEPAEALSHLGSRLRRFGVPDTGIPVEQVSQVARGEVRRLVGNCLRVLLWRRGFPYVHLGYTPAGGVFGFRVDTDEGRSTEIGAMLSLSTAAGMKFTWFINTGSYHYDLSAVAELVAAGQDVQLHGHRHRVFTRTGDNLDSIVRGRDSLARLGINVTGFAGPYGDWNPTLDRALNDAGMSYSSEFGWGYDDLPAYPIVNGKRSAVLQVPVHPICTGSLRLARCIPGKMLLYYEQVMRRQAARAEPCFIYDHPVAASHYGAVLMDILTRARTLFKNTMSLTEYAQWWRLRVQALSNIGVELDAGTVRASARWPETVPVVVEMPDGIVELCPNQPVFRIPEIGPLHPMVVAPFASRVVQTRRRTLGSQANNLLRRLRKRLQERRN